MSTGTAPPPFAELDMQPRHSGYAALREQTGVRRVTLPSGAQGWLVLRYDLVRALFTDPRLSKVPPTMAQTLASAVTDELAASVDSHMLAVDPPDHTRLRRLVSGAFTARRVAGLEPRIWAITSELLDALDGRDEVDLLEELAAPLPIRVVCELLGVPLAEQASFSAWSNTIVAGAYAVDELPDALLRMVGYIRDLLARKRADPQDDLLSALVGVREGGDVLTEDELVSTVFLLLVAGHETTVNLIANAVALLLARPAELARLRADPSLVPGTVEEALRYESPVQSATLRFPTEPVEVDGVTIPAGEIVLLSLLSADRDPQRFPDPDSFDLDRSPNPHLAFGHGVHHCLGAPLARLEGRVALESLIARCPQLQLAGGPLRLRPGVLMHGLESLPVRLRPDPR